MNLVVHATSCALFVLAGCSSDRGTAPQGSSARAVCTVTAIAPSPYAVSVREAALSPAVGVSAASIRLSPASREALPRVRDANPPAPGNGRALPRDMKLLVISADGTGYDLQSLQAALDRLGMPYDLMSARDTRLTSSMLWDADHGHYQGIILTTGDLVYSTANGTWESAFDDDEWATLRQYEAAFGVRQLSAYTFPGSGTTYGLHFVAEVDTSQTPLSARLTDAGRALFAYLNPQASIPIQHAWTYLASIDDPASTTPLLVTSDGRHAIASIHTYADGRSNLAVTAANGPALLHTLLLSYGLVDWVTGGVFLGERHVNLGVQVDDVLLGGEMWDVATGSPYSPGGKLFRITGDDYQQLIAWQGKPRPLAPDLTLELAFNGKGATGVYHPDTLTPAVQADSSPFDWVGHTYDHRTLDDVSYQDTVDELQRNEEVARNVLGLSTEDRESLVQPSVSGLENGEFLRAAAAQGVRTLVSDASLAEWNSPSFNAGFYSESQPDIFVVPRRAAGLFCNVSTPDEWTGQYNAIYGPGGARPFWDHDLTVAEILEFESNVWLRRLLYWEANPGMFHQSNLRAYDAQGHSLLGDLLDATIDKYAALFSMPIRSLPLRAAGALMQQRMAYDAAAVSATVLPAPEASPSRCVTVTLVAKARAVVPVTGLSYGNHREVYGGKTISYVDVEPGIPLSVSDEDCP